MKRAPALGGLILALAACGEPGPGTDRPDPRNIAALGDTPWKLVAVNGEDVRAEGVVLDIAGGFLSGKGPCNTINANYEGQIPEFRIGTLITTRMICDRLGLENRIVLGLQDARRATIENGRLTISGDGSPVLVFEPA